MLILGVMLGIFGNFIVSAFIEILHELEESGFKVDITTWIIMLIISFFVISVFYTIIDKYLLGKKVGAK